MSAFAPALRISRPRAGLFLIPAALLALAAAPSGVSAATEAPAPSHDAPLLATSHDIERAQALEAEARDLRDQLRRHGRAARLYRQAAELRPVDDPIRVENLRHAARMNFYAGHMRRAMRDSREAADAALRQGNVVVAAHAAMDAAWLAARAGEADRALAWIEEARMLSNSPHLDAAEREGIQRRFEGVT